MKVSPIINKLIKIIVLIIILFIVTGPFYWIVVSSIKPQAHLVRFPPDLFPKQLSWEHYTNLLQYSPYLTYLKNSLIVSLTAMLITILISSLGAYSLHRFNYPGKKLIDRSMLITYVFPGILLLVPTYTIMGQLGLLDSLWALIAINVTQTAPFCVILLRSFFKSIPIQLEEAAMLDGAGRLTILTKIISPIAASGIVACAIYSFMMSWGEYVFASVLVVSDTQKTLPVGLSGLMSQYVIDWGLMSAGSVITTLPVLIVFALLGRNLVEGLTLGAIKG